MARHFFILLFTAVVLWLCSTLCVAGDAANRGGEVIKTQKVNKESVEVFDLSKTNVEVQNSTGDGKADITLCKIKFPLFAAAKDGAITTLAEAEYEPNPSVTSGDSGNNVGVIARYFELDNTAKWKKQEIEAAIEKSKTQLTSEKNPKNTPLTVRTFVVNADGDKIYVFLVSINEGGNQQWEFKLLKGTVSKGTGGSKRIEWNLESPIELKEKNSKQKELEVYKITLFTAEGSAFLIEDKKILFVVKAETVEDDGKKNMAAVFQFEDGGNNLELVHHEKTKNGYSTFFKWESKIFKIPTEETQNNGKGKMMVFNASPNNSFTEINSGPISRLRDFLKNKNNFYIAVIQKGKSVLLFTQEQKHSGSDSSKKDVHLWMTDGTRVGYVGPIITGFTDISYGPVVYTNNNLFVLHHNYDAKSGVKEENKVNITLLDWQLETIENFVNAWNENENIIKNRYKDSATEKNLCSTDGIVGFLSGTAQEKTQWADKYLNKNANIHGTGKVEVGNGFMFTGDNAGAQWQPKQQNEQPYNFIDFGFTLLATVTVGSSGDKNSILGVGLAGNTTVGLWCTTDGKWGVSVEKSQTDVLSSEIDCTPDETYYVAFILDQGKIAVYVNGKKLSKLNGETKEITLTKNIEHFYFGADTTSAKTNVTITNVLLYNRAFTSDDVEKLKPRQNTDTTTQALSQGDNKIPENNKGTGQIDNSLPSTSPTKDKEGKKQSSSPPPTTTEDSSVRVGVVGVLCFMLFGVFTLLGRYVY